MKEELYLVRWRFPDGYESAYVATLSAGEAEELRGVLAGSASQGRIHDWLLARAEPGSFDHLMATVRKELGCEPHGQDHNEER